jgi:hypothetical protein
VHGSEQWAKSATSDLLLAMVSTASKGRRCQYPNLEGKFVVVN